MSEEHDVRRSGRHPAQGGLASPCTGDEEPCLFVAPEDRDERVKTLHPLEAPRKEEVRARLRRLARIERWGPRVVKYGSTTMGTSRPISRCLSLTNRVAAMKTSTCSTAFWIRVE